MTTQTRTDTRTYGDPKQYASSLYRTEREAAVAALFDWLIAGGLNDDDEIREGLEELQRDGLAVYRDEMLNVGVSVNELHPLLRDDADADELLAALEAEVAEYLDDSL